MRYETNDKVLLKYKGEYEVGVVTGVSKTKDSVIGYYVRSEKGSAYSLVPVDKKRRKGYDYPVIDSSMTAAWNKAVEKGDSTPTNLFAKDNVGHTRANYNPSIQLFFDGEGSHDIGHMERHNDFVFPVQGPRSF
tara:strand:- start:289 stop:690 length:402 start_codon:yes stop_codon:yes gene_type:complete